MNIKRWLISIVIVLAVMFSLGFVKFNQIQAAIAYGESFPEPSASVKSTYVETMQYSQVNEVVGQLVAPKLLTITAEYNGPITYVGFNPGDVVQQGQVLLRQDVSLEQANLKAAKARLKLAQTNYQRLAQLFREKRVSENEVDASEADVTIAEAEVDNLTSVIAKKTVIAPFEGAVGLEQFQVGQMLMANNPITTLVGIDEYIWVDFAVPQTLKQPTIGETVNVKFMQSNSAIGQAKIIAKQPTVNANSRQHSYRALLPNNERLYSHNQVVSVSVSSMPQSTVAVPTNAITRSHDGYFVYELEQDEQQNWRAKPVQVEVGERVEDMHIVLGGLSGGEFIATEGAFKLSKGLLVFTDADDQLDPTLGGEG
ncbi:efflux RND transporter periplasmic adaptor subunit [Alteromonas facilis]|uniref:efflux RND transporter periplasmic adaptor subunit n=1 Tax=Alteromonas facilis TaxID=2048004 RepID=UPI000C2866C6|nr:efflux RND transporter periplasmic adaptor subunit [Alteromonas facilis]